MKKREERQKVMIRARMRSGASWSDVCILNISGHGLGIQSASPPERGTYVEIRRGSHAIVARVVWTNGHRAGLKSQDVIIAPAVVTDAIPFERRSALRSVAERHDESRVKGRALEFACFVVVAGAVAMAAFGSVEQALAAPLSKISRALG